jgi:hypothetical protein
MTNRKAANDNLFPRDIITVDQLAELRAAGWIVVRSDAIRLAQIAARDEVRDDVREKYERECG